MIDAIANHHQVEPEPLPCTGGCGKSIDPVLHTTRSGLTLWCAGANPCSPCTQVAALNDRAQLRDRLLDRARLPVNMRRWSLDDAVKQERNEDDRAFQRRTKASGKLGILVANVEAFDAVSAWVANPTTSMWLEGEVGTGKSTLAALAVASLVVPGPSGWRERTDEELVRWLGPEKAARVPRSKRQVFVESRGTDALYIDEPELMARVRLGWSGDKDPLKKVSDSPVLVLDDVGMELAGTVKGDQRRTQVAQAMERLITYRYDRGLPLLMTSNLPWERVADPSGDALYGRRVADRLREMVGGNYWKIAGSSWRGVQQERVERLVAPSRERKPVDGRARAAGEG